eukprot:508820_1
MYNVNVLSLLTLILWFERPSCSQYVICKQCNFPYMKSKHHHCQICGEKMQSNQYSLIQLEHSEIDASDIVDENKYDDENDNITASSLSYEFGSFIYYQLLKSTYTSFKEEMIQTKHITIDEWYDMYNEGERLIQHDNAKKCTAINNYNNILKIQQISIPDILAIKFYTDFDQQQHEFRKSFRKTSQH